MKGELWKAGKKKITRCGKVVTDVEKKEASEKSKADQCKGGAEQRCYEVLPPASLQSLL